MNRGALGRDAEDGGERRRGPLHRAKPARPPTARSGRPPDRSPTTVPVATHPVSLHSAAVRSSRSQVGVT